MLLADAQEGSSIEPDLAFLQTQFHNSFPKSIATPRQIWKSISFAFPLICGKHCDRIFGVKSWTISILLLTLLSYCLWWHYHVTIWFYPARLLPQGTGFTMLKLSKYICTEGTAMKENIKVTSTYLGWWVMLGRQSVGCPVIRSEFFHWMCLELCSLVRERHTGVGVKTNQDCPTATPMDPDQIQQLSPSWMQSIVFHKKHMNECTNE